MMKKITAWLEPEKNFLLAVLGLSALLRLAFVIKTGNGGLSADAYDWMRVGWSVATGQGFAGTWRPPGYIIYLAGVFSVCGKSVIAAKIMNVVLSTATVLLAYLTARTLFGVRTARITAALMSFYPYFIAYTGDLLSETFMTFMIAAAVYAVVRAAEKASWGNLAAAGVVMGLTALTKSTVLPFLLLACAWLWWRSGRLRAPLTAGLFTALAIMPWTLRNYFHEGGSYVMPVSTPWYSFYGSCSDAAIRVEMMGEQDSPQVATIVPENWEYVSNLPAKERDRFCKEKSLEWIRANPYTFTYLLYSRVLHFWRLWPMMAYRWQKYAAMATSGVYIPLAFAGMLLSLREFKRSALLIGLLAAYTAVHLLFVVTLRYRVPVDTYVIMFAAYALAGAAGLLRRRGPGAGTTPTDFTRQAEMRKYYDESDYYTREGSVKQIGDVNTHFQRYRTSKILAIYAPGKDEKVLDLGCGWGTMEKVLCPRVKEITGVDYSAKSIEVCRKAFAEADCHNVKFLQADASATGLPSGEYDTIICADLVEHLYPAVFEKMAAECLRLLKPGGRLVIWTDCRDGILTILREHNILLEKDVSHVDYKTLEGMRGSLSAAGFEVEKAYYAESHIPVFSLFERLTMAFLPLARRRIAVLAVKPAAR
jgi:2-polyprenyl-3-methyl-5-hydroxy-6-metoxy-1,4-benzoquinol methylase